MCSTHTHTNLIFIWLLWLSLSPPPPSLSPVYLSLCVGLISRQEGDIQGSLELFRKAVLLNPTSAACVKQVARSLYV